MQFNFTPMNDFASFHCLANRAQERVLVERFSQKIQCTGLHGLYTRFKVAAAREKDDRHVPAFGRDLPLEIESIDIREDHIKDETARASGSWAREELLRAPKRFCMPTSTANQALDGFASRNIFIDHINDGTEGVRHRKTSS